MSTTNPAYVTDGSHVYLWHDEFSDLLKKGKLQPCEAPVRPKQKPLTAKQQAKLEEARKKALQAAEEAVALYKNTTAAPVVHDIDDPDILFGAPPQ